MLIVIVKATYVPSEPTGQESIGQRIYRVASDCSLKNLKLPPVKIGSADLSEVVLPDIHLAMVIDGLSYVCVRIEDLAVSTGLLPGTKTTAEGSKVPLMEPSHGAHTSSEEEPWETPKAPSVKDLELIDESVFPEKLIAFTDRIPEVNFSKDKPLSSSVTLSDGTVITPESTFWWYISTKEGAVYECLYRDVRPIITNLKDGVSLEDFKKRE